MTELDDNRDGIGLATREEDSGDPAAAFDALRRTIETQGAQIGAEMTVMRRGIEAAFDQLEKIEPQADYKPQLAQLVKALDHVSERLNGVEQSPILRQGAQHYAGVLERSGEALVRNAAQQLERQASDLERASRNLSACVSEARERGRQNKWVISAAAFGIITGVLATLFMPRILPGTVDMAVASVVMNNDRWKAGIALMESGSSGGWRSIVEASELVRANRQALSACAEAAANAKKDQRCTITVSAPAQ
ncbi:DUF6118 family protein [Brucella anthropi]|uniref:DUF6118 family protein n=1 Tax=Brucella anthropi TaxID=529 RepID=UPI00216506D1|nr:DUF6118 family protein [Brucella anthropi]MCR5944203.1 hypothetical protein [Ochrobactrum sp. XJ1]UVV71032.1 DUF6118 family protein [Brucella anthropi]